MDLIHTHPAMANELGLDKQHVIIDKKQFEKVQAMEMAMLRFIKEVDNGELWNTRNYKKFKEILYN